MGVFELYITVFDAQIIVESVPTPPKAKDVAVLQMVHENILGSYERFLLEDEELLRENYQDLCDIIEAIEQGKSEKARLVAQNHIRRFNQHMKQID